MLHTITHIQHYQCLISICYTKVMFRKVMGYPPIGQVAFTFSLLGIINASLLWPMCLGLYFSGTESMPWEKLSWIILLIASILMTGKIICYI